MLQDSTTLIDGSSVTNLTTASGTADPTGNLAGELFYRTDLTSLRVYDGSSWASVGGGSGVTSFNTRTGVVTLTSSDITTGLTYTPVNSAGDTMTGFLTLSADPTAAFHAATKQYVDNVANGMNVHLACRAGTTATLSATYNNGASGVGATLTNSGTQVAFSIDSVSLSVNDRVLIKNQSTQLQNGIYTVTTVGNGSTNWVLTRATDFDNTPTGEITAGDSTFLQEGGQATSQWVQVTSGTITVGTSNIVFTQFGGPGTYSAGTGLNLTGTTFSISTSYTGQTSITTLGTVGTGTWQGTTVGAQYGGTDQSSYTTGDILYASSSTALSKLTAGTSGYVLTSNGAGTAPSWQSSSVTPGSSNIGYLNVPQNNQDTNYTLVLTDSGKHLYHTSVTAHTYTIPANSSVAFPIGTVIVIFNDNGGGIVTIAITSDTLRQAGTTNTGSRSLAANGLATLMKVATTTWVISGSGLT